MEEILFVVEWADAFVLISHFCTRCGAHDVNDFQITTTTPKPWRRHSRSTFHTSKFYRKNRCSDRQLFTALAPKSGRCRPKQKRSTAQPNPGLDGQNSDSIWPPPTDLKSLVQTSKLSVLRFANSATDEGGVVRGEVTIRELPVSQYMAGRKH